MTRKTLILGAFVVALVGGTPALAQMKNGSMMAQDHPMKSGSMMAGDRDMKMSKSQMMSMKKCKAMSHRMMMKSRKCIAMKKMHPEMMHSGKM